MQVVSSTKSFVWIRNYDDLSMKPHREQKLDYNFLVYTMTEDVTPQRVARHGGGGHQTKMNIISNCCFP